MSTVTSCPSPAGWAERSRSSLLLLKAFPELKVEGFGPFWGRSFGV